MSSAKARNDARRAARTDGSRSSISVPASPAVTRDSASFTTQSTQNSSFAPTILIAGVKPDAKIIESVLKPTRGKRPSYSIYEQISNADEVSKALAKDPKYGKKFRTLSGIVHAGEGSNSTLGFDDLTEKDGYVFIETAPEEGLDFEQASD